MLGLPPLSHVGIVVSDLDAAADDFERRWGVHVVDIDEVTLRDASYCGRAADISTRHGFIRQGTADIELIQPVSESSPFSDFLTERRGDSVHHLAYVVDDIEDYLLRLRPMRGELVLDAYLPDLATRVVHLEGFSHGPTVELIQPSRGG